MPKRSTIIASSVIAAVVVIGGVGTGVALAGRGGGGADTATTVTVRLWDENVAKAYEKSFADFEDSHDNIDVNVSVVPWADYFTKLRADIASGDADDIFWVNSGNFEDYAANGNLMDINSVLGKDAQRAWVPSVVDQYSTDGKLWGVPQLADLGIGVFYNADLLAKAGVDPSELDDLHWDPTGKNDTLLPLLQKLTLDDKGNNAASPEFDPNHIVQYGYNAANDLNAIYINYLGSNGAALQDGNKFVFDSPEGVQAFQYLVDLINKYHVSPSAADTNTDGNFSRDQFTQGKMALFQTGVYNLPYIRDGADFDWGVAPLPAGPAGAISVGNGIIAAANAKTDHPDAVKQVLAWLGSSQGSRAIGAGGSAAPAVIGARQVYLDYWKKQGMDLSPLTEVLKNGTVQAPQGAKWQQASDAFGPIFAEIFLGRTPVAEGLAKAEDAANAAIQ